MLESYEPLLSEEEPLFETAKTALGSDPRWLMISSDEERGSLFDDWIEYRIKYKFESEEKERAQRRQAFRKVLQNCKWISVDTTWRKAQDRLRDVEDFKVLEKYDQVVVFDEHMKSIEHDHWKKHEGEEADRKQQECRNRTKLRSLLHEHLQKGIIHAKMLWQEYLSTVGSLDVITAVEQNLGGSRPKELFLDVIEEAEIMYERDTPIIDDILAKAPMKIDASSPAVESFSEHIVSNGGESLAKSSIILYIMEKQSVLKQQTEDNFVSSDVKSDKKRERQDDKDPQKGKNSRQNARFKQESTSPEREASVEEGEV